MIRAGAVHPLAFFARLKWLDGRPLLDTIEQYRRRDFEDALFSFDDDGRPSFDRALIGRAKKNNKTTDLCLAGLYSSSFGRARTATIASFWQMTSRRRRTIFR